MVSIEFFSEGATDCPLVLLHGIDPAAVARLRDDVAALSDGRAERLAIHEIPGFSSIDGCRLFASIARRDVGVCALAGAAEFECRLSATTWSNVAGLLEPFAEPTAHGFQWLDEHGVIRWVISTERGW
jgi:hypothetical protein